MSRLTRQIRIGIFLAAGIGMLIFVVLLLGRSQALFRPRATLYGAFTNTSGLVIGSPVRLAGIDIGGVEDIALSDDPRDKHVMVTLKVDESYLSHIREDSIAQMNTRGLLGDMIINITLGSPTAPALRDGAQIRTKEVEGLGQIISSVESAVSTVKGLTEVVDQRLRMVLTEDLARDLGRIAHATANVAEGIERGPGLAHAMLYDRQLSAAASDLLREGQKTAVRIGSAVEHLDAVVRAAEQGDGALHALLFDADGGKLVQSLAQAAGELDQVLAEVQHGHGIVHSLIYEKDETNLIQNLSEASALVRSMVEEVNRGKGTIGGLVKDPTIYRDLVRILGDVERNVLLKGLVRLTIRRDDLERPDVPESPKSGAAQSTP